MRRRRFLASSTALLGTAVLGRASATHELFTALGYVDVVGTHDAVVEGTTAYVAADSGFATVDVSGPTEPTVLAERRDVLEGVENGPLGMIFDVAVEDDVLVVAGPANSQLDSLDGFAVYDVSDPTAPERTGVFRTDHPIHNLDLSDGVAYLTGNNGADNPLVAVDLAGPREVGRWSLLDEDDRWGDVQTPFRVIHDVVVQNGRAYVAHWDAGTWIVDVSDHGEMVAVAQVRGRSPGDLGLEDVGAQEYTQLPGNDHYVTTNEDATLLGVGAEAWAAPGDDSGGPGGIELYDIATPTDPQRLARIDPPPTEDATYSGEWTTSHNFDLVGDRLYSSWYRGGVRIHDVSDPATPRQLAAWEDRDTAECFTAKKVDDRPFFIASSTKGGSGGDGVNSGLYTFPAVDDEGSPLFDPHSSGGTAPATSTATTATGSVATATDRPETTASEPPETTPADGTTLTEDGDGPGFGALAALAGIAGGGWYTRRRGRDGE